MNSQSTTFKEEKVYTGQHHVAWSRVSCDEDYVITFTPDGNVSITRKYSYYRDNDGYACDEEEKETSSFKGTYTILQDDEEERIVNISLKQRTIDSWKKCEKEEKYEAVDEVYEKVFDLIEKKLKNNLVGFTSGKNVFSNFNDVPLSQEFSYQYDKLVKIFGEDNSKIYPILKKYGAELEVYLLENYPSIDFNEKFQKIVELTGISESYKVDLYVLLAKCEGDEIAAIKTHEPVIVELISSLEPNGTSLEEVLKLYKNCHRRGESDPQVYIHYKNRYVLYADQNEKLKNYYGLTNEEENYNKLYIFNGDIK
jgi:hypothetical protein